MQAPLKRLAGSRKAAESCQAAL